MLHNLPTLNAILNSITLILLCCGYRAIKGGERKRHRNFMISALVCSALFLTSYLTYHFTFGHKVFPDLGWIKTLYLIILIPHIFLATAMVPFILLTFFFAFTGRWTLHKKFAGVVFPVWIFVSLSGITVYCLLVRYYF